MGATQCNSKKLRERTKIGRLYRKDIGHIKRVHMIWDVAFILGRYPPQYRFNDRHYVMLPVSDAMIKGLSELSDKHIPGANFFESTRREHLTAFSFRCTADSEEEAFEKAQDTIAGFID